MSATQLGNQNASKWTREKTLHTLTRIEQIATDEFSAIYTLTQALNKIRCYKQLWSYWKKKWENDEEIMDLIYFIESLFIEKLEHGGLFKRLNVSTCHFILRTNYGYNTKGESELPSHLRHEFPELANEKVPTGSKTKKEKAPKPLTAEELYEQEYVNDPAYKDFSPRATDNEVIAALRADAAKNPHLYTAKPPLHCTYIQFAEDLFAPNA
ncbi:MAG: hypothetical protein JSS76_14835 [Bacteroidetes bacterium]|nr:hypothetical protein [Bacteroidota bacterium]